MPPGFLVGSHRSHRISPFVPSPSSLSGRPMCASPSIDLTTVIHHVMPFLCHPLIEAGILREKINENCMQHKRMNASYRGCRTRILAREEWYYWPCMSHPIDFHLHHHSSYLYSALLRSARASRQRLQQGRRRSLLPNLCIDQSYDLFYFRHTTDLMGR